MDAPFFSIIVPVYNAGKYINDCLDSIISQSFANWECILVDDGSEDDGGSVCDEFANTDSRFVVVHKQNEGVSRARNTGLEKSRGHWLVFIDSDDYIQKDYLSNIEKCISSDVDFVLTGYTEFQEDEIIRKACYQYGVYKSEEKKEIISTILSSGTPWAKAYKNEIVKRNNLWFDKNLSISEDRLFLYNYLPYVNSICVTDKSAYYYRHTPNSISSTRRKPLEYLYRLDALGESAIKVKETWNLSIRQFYPFVEAHCAFACSVIEQCGVEYLVQNSKIINNKDYFGVNKSSVCMLLFTYLKLRLIKTLIYNRRWFWVSLLSKQI